MSSSSSTAGGQAHSRSSTPATDVSPPRTPDFVLPPPTAETLRRRAQSDRASSEIGARMLKGWAMLSDECTNEDCWAIPLVRPPRARPGAQPDPRKECVICGTVYITDENGELVAQPAPTTRGNATSSSSSQRPKETRTELPSNAAVTIIQDVPRAQPASVASSAPIIINTRGVPASTTAFSSAPQQASTSAAPFSSATGALQGALDSLSQRLIQVSTASNLDVKQVKDTAEAMDVVMRSLQTARQLSGGA
ncbi:hypothetical protein FRC07_003998 [Ceratobasidium sp. 392]|nr:hypothetical protein FRC07_003998 [Ceratobasidium sp. 392]